MLALNLRTTISNEFIGEPINATSNVILGADAIRFGTYLGSGKIYQTYRAKNALIEAINLTVNFNCSSKYIVDIITVSIDNPQYAVNWVIENGQVIITSTQQVNDDTNLGALAPRLDISCTFKLKPDNSITGTGLARYRVNEITSEDDAWFREWIVKTKLRDKQYGVIKDLGHEFEANCRLQLQHETRIVFNETILPEEIINFFDNITYLGMQFTYDNEVYHTEITCLVDPLDSEGEKYKLNYGNNTAYYYTSESAFGWKLPREITLIETYILPEDKTEVIKQWLINNTNLTEESFSTSNTIHLTDGKCIAYGYLGIGKEVDINFIIPATKQYYFIYGEFDRSVRPNTFIIKTKNNHADPEISRNTFRQDDIETINGKFEVPLWRVTATNRGIMLQDIREIGDYDLRNFIEYGIYMVSQSETTSNVKEGGTLGEGVTCHTPTGNNNKEVANVEYVIEAVEAEIIK